MFKSSYAANFPPETLQVAFDMPWSEVSASPGIQVDQEAARKMIAVRIVNDWRDHGERDPQRLKAYATEGLLA